MIRFDQVLAPVTAFVELCLRSKNVPTLSTGNTSGTDAGEGCEERRRHAARAAKR